MILLVIIWMSLSTFNAESFLLRSSEVVSEEPLLSTATLYIFTGSDWCADCRRLEKNVLNDTAFKTSMEINKIAVEIIDFPQRKKLSPETKKHNELIAEAYNFQGIFPTLILSRASGSYETLQYRNEQAAEFSEIVLNKLSNMNE